MKRLSAPYLMKFFIDMDVKVLFRGALFLLPPNEVCEGYVFTGVCLSTGGLRAQAHMSPRHTQSLGMHAPSGTHACPPPPHPPGHAHPQARMAPDMHTPATEHTCPSGTHAPPSGYYEVWSMSGQLASYWNAFLFIWEFPK